MILGERVPLTSCPANHSLKKGQMTTEKYKDQTHQTSAPFFLSEPQFYTSTNVRELGNCKVSDFAWLDPGASICTEKNLF